MTGRELIKWIQDNNAEDFNVCAPGERDIDFWAATPHLWRLIPFDDRKTYYRSEKGSPNSILIF